jgi:transposase
MSSELGSAVAAPSTIYLGMDVHKESITIAVLPADARVPTRLDRLPNDAVKLRRYLARLARSGELRACYEASGAGYVIHRAMREWGHACDVIAPSLIPKRPGVQRKHDKRDAAELARLYRAGELTAVRIPSEAEERVRDLVRCRETFQREIVKSRHYILKFLARRGFVYREGCHWRSGHLRWLRHLASAASPLAPEDRLVFSEYLFLLDYKLQRREELDRQVEQLALTLALAAAVGYLQCFPRALGPRRDGARDGVGRLAPLRAPRAVGGLRRPRLARGLDGRARAQTVDHQSGQQSLPARARPSRVELPLPTAPERRDPGAAAGTTGGRDRARVEGAAALAQTLSPSRLSEVPADRGGRRGARAGRLPVGGDAGPARSGFPARSGQVVADVR